MRQKELTRLGYAGLAPFVASAIGVLAMPEATPNMAAIIGTVYSAIIASYMAGMGAGGLIVSGRPADRALLPGMIASLIAWLAALPLGLSETAGLVLSFNYIPQRCVLMIAVFIYLLKIDLEAVAANGLPGWYAHLRKRLTLGACISLATIAAGVSIA
ncbi:MAG: DUF3429 domain-containing protein [Parvularculaceae bacterium]|nr:MAG: DUF3429 domain-containing protein [Parvularculaceae bacterium]